MATLTLRDFPDELLARLAKKQPADLDRSTLREIARRVSEAAGPDEECKKEEPGLRSAHTQADAWARLAGRWKSDLPVEKEIEEILRARTAGREISL
jgi:hypothetical protein